MERNAKRLVVTTVLYLFVAVVVWSADTRTVTLLGSSDIHGYFLPWDYSTDTVFPGGGLSKIATVVQRVRAGNPNTIVVDAGDLIQGNFAETFKADKENPMIKGLNAIGYDVWVPGNHEFNFGLGVFKEAVRSFKGTVLAGNMFNKGNGDRLLPAFTIVERGGIKIGIIGMTTPMTAQFEAGSDHVSEVEFRKPGAETRAAIAALKGRVDAIVGVMHLGENNENGYPETGVTDVITAAPGMDVVVASHMHVRIQGKDINGTLVVEPFVFAQNLCRVDLEFEKVDSGWKLVGKKPELIALASETSDPVVEKVYESYHQTLRGIANSVIGKVVGGNMVERDTIPGVSSVLVADTPLVSLFHEACLYYSKADVVALHIDNGAPRMDQGDIRRKDIAFNYSFALGEITTYPFTVEELKSYMEWSADYYNTLKPGDVTVSFNPTRRTTKYNTNDFFGGIKYTIDLSRKSGDRVKNIRYPDGREIPPGSKVIVGMNCYRMAQLVARGGCLEGKEFKALTDTRTVYGEDEGTIRNLVVRYIQEVKKGVVEASCDNNWTLTGMDSAYGREKGIVEGLLKQCIITVPGSGTYTNIGSINVAGKIAATQAEYDRLMKECQFECATASGPEAIARSRTGIELVKALKLF